MTYMVEVLRLDDVEDVGLNGTISGLGRDFPFATWPEAWHFQLRGQVL
jgi:hypothetical protein